MPYNHSNYEGIKSTIFDPNMDSRVTEDEVFEAAKSMNRKSAAKCGIPLEMLLAVINPMLGILSILFYSVFTSPKLWIPFVLCLP